MRIGSMVLWLVVAGGCAEDKPVPLPPEKPAAVPAPRGRPVPPPKLPPPLALKPVPSELVATAPRNAVAVLVGSSRDELERDFDWLRHGVDGRPWNELLARNKRPTPVTGGPIAVAWRPSGEPVLLVPYSRGYWSTSPVRRGGAALAGHCVDAPISWRISTSRISASDPPEGLSWLVPWRTSIASVRLGARRVRQPLDSIVLDVAVEGRRGSALDRRTPDGPSSPLVDLVRALPRAYSLTFAAAYERESIDGLYRGFAMLAARAGLRAPPLALPRDLGRGIAVGAGLTKDGFEAVLLARTADPIRLLAELAQTTRRRFGAAAITRVIELPSEEIDEVDVGRHLVSFSVRDDAAPRPVAPRGYRALRAAGGFDAAATRHDATVLRARFRVTIAESSPFVATAPDYLFLTGTPEQDLGTRLFLDLTTRRGVVRFRRARRPEADERAALAAALTREPKRSAPIEADGGGWFAVDGDALLPDDWPVDGWVLLADDEENLTNEDVDWAWVSTGRLGPRARTRDVSLRWKKAAVKRWQAFASRPGSPHFAVVADGEVLAVTSYLGPVAAEADVLDVPPQTALRLAAYLAAPPLRRDYTDDGRRPRAFADDEKHADRIAEVLGGRTFTICHGAVESTAFVGIGTSNKLAQHIVRALTSRLRPAPEPFESMLQEAGGTVRLLARWDTAVTYDAFARLVETPPSQRLTDFAAVRPVRLVAWHEGRNVRARLTIDARLADLWAKFREGGRPDRSLAAARRLHAHVGTWREKHASKIPTRKDLADVDWRDAWNRTMRVERGGIMTFRVRSPGPDGAFDTDDDVVAETQG